MKNLLVVLALMAISLGASAAGLLGANDEGASGGEAQPKVSQEAVIEGTACPGVGATGFTESGLLLSCQSGASATLWALAADGGGQTQGGWNISCSNASYCPPLGDPSASFDSLNQRYFVQCSRRGYAPYDPSGLWGRAVRSGEYCYCPFNSYPSMVAAVTGLYQSAATAVFQCITIPRT